MIIFAQINLHQSWSRRIFSDKSWRTLFTRASHSVKETLFVNEIVLLQKKSSRNMHGAFAPCMFRELFFCYSVSFMRFRRTHTCHMTAAEQSMRTVVVLMMVGSVKSVVGTRTHNITDSQNGAQIQRIRVLPQHVARVTCTRNNIRMTDV